MTLRLLLRQSAVCGVVLVALAACATPETIRARSAASTQLYADVMSAYGEFARATEQELRRRDRLEQEIAVQLGERPPQLDSPFKPAESTRQVSSALEAWGLEVESLQILHGTVDRFLQIQVVDLDEIKAVTTKASDAFKGR